MYGILGVGALATAIVTGLCDGVADPPSIVLSPRNAERSADLAACHASVRVAADNQEVVDAARVMVLSLRPQDAEQVLTGLAFDAGQVLISAIAAIDVDRLRGWVEPAHRIARVIPLPAVAERASATPVHPAIPEVEALFGPLGGVVDVPEESIFEALSAASATLAAHFRYLGEVADWLAVQGYPEAAARQYVTATFANLSTVLRGDADLAAMAREHATPGGLNEQFARHLADAGVFAAVRDGLDAVHARLVGRPPVAGN